jgi:dienelactone hydrolase
MLLRQEARPLYFPSGEQSLFGWLHAARGAAVSDMGVVVCKPFGYEAVCAHEALVALADGCAAAGMHTLRFDYSGTGDSSDAPDSDEISRWCEDICAAIDMLQRDCGVRRICLLGMRLGATLGAMVAARRQIDCQIVIAPVISGRRYVREMRVFQAGATAANGATTPQSSDYTGLEVGGFRLSSKGMEALKGVDLMELPPLPGTAALVIDRNDLADAERWAGKLQASGVPVRYTVLPGYLDMVSAPHGCIVPVAMIEAIGSWLGIHAKGLASAEVRAETKLPAGARMRFRSRSGVELTERATFFDGERILLGIVTERAEATTHPNTVVRGVILLNCGTTSHIGPNRMSVDTARDWAAEGYVVLRLDIAGVADSSSRPAEPRNQVYPPSGLYDISLAVEFLRRRRGVTHLTLMGVCSGAYHALRSAITGLPVNKVVMINPGTFYLPRGGTRNLHIWEVMRNPAVYVEKSFSLHHWGRLLRGRVNVWRVGKIFIHRAWLAIDSPLRNLCRALRIRIVDDLGWDLALVAERGIPMVFVFAKGDPGLGILRNQGGSMLNKLGPTCRICVIDGADHIFSQYPARAKLVDLLRAELAP